MSDLKQVSQPEIKHTCKFYKIIYSEYMDIQGLSRNPALSKTKFFVAAVDSV